MDLLLFLSKTVFRMAWTKDCGRGRVFSIRLWGIVPIHLSGLLCNNLLLKELLGLLAAKEFLNQVVVKALIKILSVCSLSCNRAIYLYLQNLWRD